MISEFKGKFRFLSNFFNCPNGVLYDNYLYKTSEHAYQSAKSDYDLYKDTLRKSHVTPAMAKQMGSEIGLKYNWEEIKDNVMLEVVRNKFNRNELLAQLLFQTEDQELIEGNNWGDKYWGQVDGVGQNKLGKILMQVRDELIKED